METVQLNTTDNDDLQLSELLATVWRRKWVIIAITLLASSAAFVISRLTQPVYEASATLLIDLPSQSRLSEFSGIAASDRGVRTFAKLITTRPVIDEAHARMEADSGEEDHGDARVEFIENTQLIELIVEDTNRFRAAALANTIVDVFKEQNDAFQASRFASSRDSLVAELDKLSESILNVEAAITALDDEQVESNSPEFQRLQRELTQNQTSYLSLLGRYEDLRLVEGQLSSTIIQVEPAVPPANPIRPRVTLNTLVSGVAGAVFALGIVFLVEQLDRSIKIPQDVFRASGLQVIGFIANSRKLRDRKSRTTLMLSEPNFTIAESFRSLRTNIELSDIQGTPRSILISSPSRRDGKTTIAAQLAMTMAQGGKSVILLDANLRMPMISEYFGIENRLGLSDMLVDDLVPQIVAQETAHWRLKVVTSGKTVEYPSDLLGSVQMLKVLSRLREQCDVAVFDSAPIGVSESLVLATKLESVLLVIEHGQTQEPELRQVMEQLARTQANVLGVVLNQAPERLTHPGKFAYENGKGAKARASDGAEPSLTKGGVFTRSESGGSKARSEGGANLTSLD